MAKTISQLTELTTAPEATDEVVINDAGVTKRVSIANLVAAAFLAGTKTASEAFNLAVGTATGTQIATASNQRLGFYGATPVIQQAQTSDLLDSLQTVGLIATGAGDTPLNLTGGAVTCGTVTSSGAITSSSASGGIGYATGAGGTGSQSSAKTDGVTINRPTGRITMSNATLNANTTVTFTLTNSNIAANDLLVLNHVSGGTAGSYALNAQCAAGTATINVRNLTSSGLGEAIVIGFAVIKAATS